MWNHCATDKSSFDDVGFGIDGKDRRGTIVRGGMAVIGADGACWLTSNAILVAFESNETAGVWLIGEFKRNTMIERRLVTSIHSFVITERPHASCIRRGTSGHGR